MAGLQKIRFRLTITAEQYIEYYKGRATSVTVRVGDGRRIRFPASALRPFVTGSGVCGLFELTITEENRLVSFDKIGG